MIWETDKQGQKNQIQKTVRTLRAKCSKSIRLAKTSVAAHKKKTKGAQKREKHNSLSLLESECANFARVFLVI